MENLPDEILALCLKLNDKYNSHVLFGENALDYFEVTPEKVGTYDTNNGVIAFVTPDMSYYITPYTADIMQILVELKYRERHLSVPFSCGGKTIEDEELKRFWAGLQGRARRINNMRELARRTEYYKQLMEEKGFKALPEDIYNRSLEIPENGILAVGNYKEDIIVQPFVEFDMARCMGNYNHNNGVTVFVDEKGKTYVTPFRDIGMTLEATGYQEKNLFVPLSNAEIIKDPKLNQQWTDLYYESRLPIYQTQSTKQR